MSFFKFIFSKTFLIQLGIAVILIVALIFGTMSWLDFTTNHDQRIKVPDLSKLSLDIVEKKLDEFDLRVKLMDSANYNPDYPPFSVIEQVPAAGKFVKEDRKIYIKLNPSGYPKLEIPEFERITKRQVESKLLSLGFEIGDITYKPDFAENAVLELSHNGKRLKAGDKLKKTAIIDMVLGDGQVNYNSER